LALPTASTGEAGIDALRLHHPPYNLIGRKIAIGQVEIGRPGQFGLDKAVSINRAIALAGVYLRSSLAKSNKDIDPMRKTSPASWSVLTKPYRSGTWSTALCSCCGFTQNWGQPEECLSAQQVALQNGVDVRAINFSFGETLERDSRPNPVLDGKALLTQCIDWSARVHNVLYVIAGNQGKGAFPSRPTTSTV
jgi:hypothetical protein